MTETPFYVEAQLKSLLRDAQELAATKRLADAFAMELFSLGRAVDEALEARSTARAKVAVEQARKLIDTLQAAPDKSDGLLMR